MPTRHNGTEEERLALDVFIKLNRACASVNRNVHAPLRESGLTLIQFGVLDVIYHAGPSTISVIAEKNLTSQNSLSTVIDTMERNGLVCRERSLSDRRVIDVYLTLKGKSLYQEIWPTHLTRIVEAVSVLSNEEKRDVDRLLKKLGSGAILNSNGE